MNPKTSVTAADIYVLLDREFRRRRKARDCTMCFVQLPYRVDVRDAGIANWEAILPLDCGRDCGQVLAELLEEFQSLYDLKSPSDVAR